MTSHTTSGRFATGVTATLLAIAFTGCSTTAPASESEGASDVSDPAAQMVSCLKAGGVQARVSEHTGLLTVQTDAGFDAEVTDDGTTVASTQNDQSEDGSSGPIAIEDIDSGSGKAWAAYNSSRDLSSDPDLQEIYQQCEEKVPDFTQPQFSPESDPRFAEFQAQAQKEGLEFAKCARDEGFSWAEDPEDGAFLVGDDVTEEDLRGALKACFKPEYTFGWGGSGTIDLGGILDEFMSPGGTNQ